jgi:hypothetical protein
MGGISAAYFFSVVDPHLFIGGSGSMNLTKNGEQYISIRDLSIKVFLNYKVSFWHLESILALF